MILGLRTAIVPTPDLAAGKAWYAQAFETQPYFDEPFYVGFAIGGFELGLVPDEPAPGESGPLPGAPVRAPYPMWGVTDIEAERARLLELGAQPDQPVTDVGGDIRVCSVFDPFGNPLHLIQNPHFDPRGVR